MSTGPMRLIPGWNPILRAKLRRKDKSENILVPPTSAKPVFLSFPVFLVPQLSPLLGFEGLTVFHCRGPKIQDLAGSALATA